MWACENNHFEIGRLLLKYQPQVNIQDKVRKSYTLWLVKTLFHLYRKSGLHWCWPVEQETWR